jgi:CRISPR/Cas system-associated protein Csx1
MELNKPFIQHFYYDFAPTELISCKENHIDQLVYQLYELTEEEIKIIEAN